MTYRSPTILLASAALIAASAVAAPAWAQSRGELLYSTHCIACHTTQKHWRDKKLATDWDSLKAQVSHWQAIAMLGWDEADIVEVTRHLNQGIYRFAQPAGPRASLGPQALDGPVQAVAVAAGLPRVTTVGRSTELETRQR